MANRLRNAPTNAAGLSGKDMGNIIATEMAPKTNPLIMPPVRFDMLRLNAPNRHHSMLIFQDRGWDALPGHSTSGSDSHPTASLFPEIGGPEQKIRNGLVIMAQDYLLRLIEQVSQMIAEILALRKVGRISDASEQIEAMCQQNIGLPFDLVKRSAPETILQLLESGGGTQHVRAVMLAELLLQDAELNDAAGKNREASISRAQAYVLLARNIDKLSPDEQAVYRPKLETLNAQTNPPSNG
jgi:hypothetical protein